MPWTTTPSSIQPASLFGLMYHITEKVAKGILMVADFLGGDFGDRGLKSNLSKSGWYWFDVWMCLLVYSKCMPCGII